MDKLLKPCPFCGSNDIHEVDPGKGDHWVRCSACQAQGPNNFAPWQAWNTRTGETAPTMSEEEIENIIMLESNLDVEKINHLAKALSGKLPKQPTYSEEEIYNISCRCDTRNDFVKALSGKLQQPRKVEREEILEHLTQAHMKGQKFTQKIDPSYSGARADCEPIVDLIMKEIGGE